MQSIDNHLLDFNVKASQYIIVDECYHAVAHTYQRIFSYFESEFILRLTATLERADSKDILEFFQNIIHKIDLRTAVEKGILAPIRCIRVKNLY